MHADLDTKEFLVQHEIIWPIEHQRISSLFSKIGAVVFYVESAWPGIWTVSVLRTAAFDYDIATKVKVRSLLFHHAQIPVRREEPHVVSKGRRLEFVFGNRAGDQGVRFTFHCMNRKGKITPSWERIELPEHQRPPNGYMQRLAS